MIFSKELIGKVLRGEKTVTRRLKPQPVGALRAVQRGRGKFAEAYIMILSCEDEEEWFRENQNRYFDMPDLWDSFLYAEARKEGFGSWGELWSWFEARYGEIPSPLYRIEYRLEESYGRR